ncbi:MAG: hypothetical protein AB1345_04315 [Chloroflexota bacterium]
MKKKRKWLIITGGILLILMVIICNRLLGDRPSVAWSTQPAKTSTVQPTLWVMYFCGMDRCQNSGEYGQLIFPTGINIWQNHDPNRGTVIRKANHGDKVLIIESKRIDPGSGGLWFHLQSDGWVNDLWLTDVLCTPENLERLTQPDC